SYPDTAVPQCIPCGP
nr:vasotocin-associated neurophysin, MSEL-neurophysin {N-terminal} [Bufo regularis=African toads, Peptide Partial, 15 aa] [Sclerophrys regularis]